MPIKSKSWLAAFGTNPTLLDIVLRQSPSLRAASLHDEIGWISITIVPWSAFRICRVMMVIMMMVRMVDGNLMVITMMVRTCSFVQLSPSSRLAHQCAWKSFHASSHLTFHSPSVRKKNVTLNKGRNYGTIPLRGDFPDFAFFFPIWQCMAEATMEATIKTPS